MAFLTMSSSVFILKTLLEWALRSRFSGKRGRGVIAVVVIDDDGFDLALAKIVTGRRVRSGSH